MLRSRPLLATTLLFVLIVPLLLLAGLLVHNVIADSLRNNHTIRTARTDVAAALQQQLDEETGLRGFVDTKQTLYLEPFQAGRGKLGQTLARLRGEIPASDDARPELMRDLDAAASLNAKWLTDVADPLRLAPGGAGSDRLQLEGKSLVDAFRDRLSDVNERLTADQEAGDGKVAREVDLILFVVGLAGVVIVVAGVVYTRDQQRLTRRLEHERSRTENERRKSATLRAAYETEKRIADTLQEGFSQRKLPVLPTVHFSASYIPATEETRVGGDWYDAVELSESRVLFTIGDVAGHGLDAAVTMNRARQAVLGSALLDADPAQILARINAEFVREGAPMVTAIVGIADSKTFEFVFATAGHPPPVLVEPGREARMLEVGGLPLGVVESAKYRTIRMQSLPGAVLVLYTDGAVEHSHDVLEGEELLLSAASSVLQVDERDAATSIHQAIFNGRPVGDDVAILTVGFATDRGPGLIISAEHAQSTISGVLARGAESSGIASARRVA